MLPKFFTTCAVALLVFSPILVYAQPLTGADVPPTTPVTIAYVINVLKTVVNWMFSVLIILAVICIIIAAFNYLTAAGDPEKVKKAHTMLIYALVAIGVALLAVGLRALVAELLQRQTPIY